MKKIALIVPYFGKFKNYFLFWRKSAENNPTIDFLVYTDQEIEVAENIKVIRTNLEEISLLAISKLSKYVNNEINWVGVNSPYKLCDYKPLYGVMFEDDLKEYDFWGHCDVDLIFGNIRNFITDDILERFDRICTRGHFTLYRNNRETNMAFLDSKVGGNALKIPDYEQVYTSDRSFSFDEWPGMSLVWRSFKSELLYDEIIFDDIHALKGHFVSCQKEKKEPMVKNVIFLYENGTLYRCYEVNGVMKTEETMYVHFQKRDMIVETENFSKYLIVPNRFIPYDEPNLLLLKKYGRKQYLYIHAIKMRWNNLIKKIKCLILHRQ